ncbi:Crp/Fnr family transcriptional regulator [uncultured Cetobacterium sp.]|uniref:Crp/Fnr family transcriptional regulator n=1 Tax=uncultured Cetobacterium sp. TaxID=527638 RepID=UPI0025D798DD|nr:Crp/Fnr family transcriptional regulator [uncultured Cetobacterium sp.]
MNFDFLKKVILFKDLEENEIKEMFNTINFDVKKFEKDDIVFFRGDVLDGISIVLKGNLSAEMLKDTGDIQKIENLSTGDLIASAFVFGQNNIIPVDLISLEKTEILHIDKKNLLKLFNIKEMILINFLNEISDKTQFLSNKVWKSFNAKTIREKMFDYIQQNKIDNKILFKHSIKELSEIFGVSRPSLSRVISEFVEEGILERDGKNRFKLNL